MTLIAADGLLLQSILQSWYAEVASPDDNSGKSGLADYNMAFASKNIILNSCLYLSSLTVMNLN